jgi:hypothetical protein
MAKLPATDSFGNPIPGGGPDSATSEWFINIADNGGAPYMLDSANGGYTVFGHVLDTGPGTGMDVVDMIASLPHPDPEDADMQGIPFPELPLFNYDPANDPDPSNLVIINGFLIPNVTSVLTQWGTWATFIADADMIFVFAGTADTATAWQTNFTPPPNKTVEFADDIYTFTITGTMSTAGHVVTLLNGSVKRPTHYYAIYSPTEEDPVPHWYDFTFDGETGAEIVGGKIVLHFVDGKRGDDDGTVNGSITHIGTPVLATDIVSTTSSGCTIATVSSQTSRGGDWILVSLFLTMLALARKRARQSKSLDD